MGRIDFNLEPKKEEKFRNEVFRTKGMKKGNITEALEEAIDLWMNEQAKKKSKDSKK